jgi:hypothetical protein
MGPPTTWSARGALAVLALTALPGGLRAQGKPSPAQRAPKGVITTGKTVQDSLVKRDLLLPADSTYAQEWRLAGTAGETVTIDLASDAFDAYAFLLGAGLKGEAPQDDDSGGHCNARLTVRLPATGDYFIVVTSTDKLKTGAFTLSVTAGPKPKALARCDR